MQSGKVVKWYIEQSKIFCSLAGKMEKLPFYVFYVFYVFIRFIEYANKKNVLCSSM